MLFQGEKLLDPREIRGSGSQGSCSLLFSLSYTQKVAAEAPGGALPAHDADGNKAGRREWQCRSVGAPQI